MTPRSRSTAASSGAPYQLYAHVFSTSPISPRNADGLTGGVIVGVEHRRDRLRTVRRLDRALIVTSYKILDESISAFNVSPALVPLKLCKSNPRFGLLSHNLKLFVVFVSYPGIGTSYAIASTSWPPDQMPLLPSRRSEWP